MVRFRSQAVREKVDVGILRWQVPNDMNKGGIFYSLRDRLAEDLGIGDTGVDGSHRTRTKNIIVIRLFRVFSNPP